MSTHWLKTIALRPLAATSSRSASSRSSLALWAGGRIEIANLLQPQHQLEDVLDRGRVAHVGQPQHSFFLGHLIRLALLGRQFELGIAKHLGRQLGQHLVFRAPQHVVAGGLPHAPGLHVRRKMPGRQKLENAHQILRTVFDRRAGQRPTASAADRPHCLAGVAGAVFDPLCLVEDDQVEIQASRRPAARDRAAGPRSWRS